MTHAGLFEGIGAFSLGAERAGINTIWYSEIDNYKQNILKKNFPNAKLYGKIQNIQSPDYADILSGGFPCPDISIAGKGIGIIGHRSGLWSEMYRIATEIRPAYIIGENSPMLTRRGFEYILYDLARIGYDVQWTYLSAAQFGYRHIRKRLFFVAYAGKVRRNKQNDGFYKHVSEIFPEGSLSRQPDISMSIKRFGRGDDLSGIRKHPRFSEGLDKNRIIAIGDSVNVDIAHYLFECIKMHNIGK